MRFICYQSWPLFLSETKSQFARDDPAFLVLLSVWLCGKSKPVLLFMLVLWFFVYLKTKCTCTHLPFFFSLSIFHLVCLCARPKFWPFHQIPSLCDICWLHWSWSCYCHIFLVWLQFFPFWIFVTFAAF